MFTPEDIENFKLQRAVFGGYRARATRQYLRQIAWDLSHVLHERDTFEDEARRFRAQLLRYEQREKSESARLDGARDAAREIREEARRDAELILTKACKQANEIRASAEKQPSSRMAELHALEEKSRITRTKLRGLITSVREALAEQVDAPPKRVRTPVLDDLVKSVRAAATQSRRSSLRSSPEGGDGQPTDGKPALAADGQGEWNGGEHVA